MMIKNSYFEHSLLRRLISSSLKLPKDSPFARRFTIGVMTVEIIYRLWLIKRLANNRW